MVCVGNPSVVLQKEITLYLANFKLVTANKLLYVKISDFKVKDLYTFLNRKQKSVLLI